MIISIQTYLKLPSTRELVLTATSAAYINSSPDPRVEWGFDGSDRPDITLGPTQFAAWLTGLANRALEPEKIAAPSLATK